MSDGRYELRNVVISLADLELIHSALMYYRLNGGSHSDLDRRRLRQDRAENLAYDISNTLKKNWTIDEDGTGRTVSIVR